MNDAERQFLLDLRQGLRIQTRAIERYLGLAEDETQQDRKVARAVQHRGVATNGREKVLSY